MKLPNISKIALIGVSILFSYRSYGKCLGMWQYYMPITITNNIASSLSSYQTKVIVNTSSLISMGKMINTGDDIRFVDPNTCNTLSYWIESGINTTSTIIWVKIPNIPGNSNTIINLYYGNSNAKPVSNGDSTFLLFDDFNGNSINSTKWDSFSSNASFAVSGSYFNVRSGSGSTVGVGVIVSKSSFISPICLEGMITTAGGSYTCLTILNSGTWDGYSLYYGANTPGTLGMSMGQAYSGGGSYAAYVKKTNPTAGKVTGIWQLTWPGYGSQYGLWPGGSKSTSLTDITLATSVQVSIGNLYQSLASSTYDWVRVRSYATSEPSSSIAQEIANHTSSLDMQNLNNSISIYPNPVHDMVHVSFNNELITFQNLLLIDMNGKIIRQFYINGQAGSIDIKTKDIQKGIYFIKLIGIKATTIQKIVLE